MGVGRRFFNRTRQGWRRGWWLVPVCCGLLGLLGLAGGGAVAAERGDDTEYLRGLAPEVAAAKLVQRLEEGDLLPDFSLISLGDGATVTKANLPGKPAVLLFFGLDNEARRERSFALLSLLAKMQGVHGEAIRFLAILSDPAGATEAREYLKREALTYPVLDDGRRTVYTLFGIFMMPEMLVIDKDGRLDAKVPYTADVEAALSRELKIVLGELTPEEAEGEARKPLVEASPEMKKYNRHLNLARVMARRKLYAKAIEEYTTAAALRPEDAAALTEMGFIKLKMEDWPGAVTTFEKILDREPDAMDAVAGLGLALHGAGRDDEAWPELLDASMVVRPLAAVFIAMAEIQAGRGEKDEALAMYRKGVKQLLSEMERQQDVTAEPAP